MEINENIDNISLEEIKEKISNKEKNISESQIEIYNLEKRMKKLEKKIKNINKRKKGILLPLFFRILQSTVMCSVLIFYVSSFIDSFLMQMLEHKNIFVIELCCGVIFISVLGSIAAAKSDKLVKNYQNNKIIKLSKELDKIKKNIIIENEKQETIKKEITSIIETHNNQIYEYEKTKSILKLPKDKAPEAITSRKVYTRAKIKK